MDLSAVEQLREEDILNFFYNEADGDDAFFKANGIMVARYSTYGRCTCSYHYQDIIPYCYAYNFGSTDKPRDIPGTCGPLRDSTTYCACFAATDTRRYCANFVGVHINSNFCR